MTPGANRRRAECGIGRAISRPTPAIRCAYGCAGDKAWLNIKSATVGVTRLEYEYEIPAADANGLLEHLCVKPLIEKTRFVVEHDSRAWEIDVFEGDNAGLVVAEIELESAGEEFTVPVWAGQDVSDDVRYYNQRLVEHPYSRWPK